VQRLGGQLDSRRPRHRLSAGSIAASSICIKTIPNRSAARLKACECAHALPHRPRLEHTPRSLPRPPTGTLPWRPQDNAVFGPSTSSRARHPSDGNRHEAARDGAAPSCARCPLRLRSPAHSVRPHRLRRESSYAVWTTLPHGRCRCLRCRPSNLRTAVPELRKLLSSPTPASQQAARAGQRWTIGRVMERDEFRALAASAQQAATAASKRGLRRSGQPLAGVGVVDITKHRPPSVLCTSWGSTWSCVHTQVPGWARAGYQHYTKLAQTCARCPPRPSTCLLSLEHAERPGILAAMTCWGRMHRLPTTRVTQRLA
jgi:hypothetical protein